MKTTSLELSQRLKALNVPQVSYFTWVKDIWDIYKGAREEVFGEVDELYVLENWKGQYAEDLVKKDTYYSSYSSDELGEWLKSYVDYKAHTWEVSHNGREYLCGNILLDEDGVMSSRQNFFGDTLAEAMGLMLEYLIINGYIKVEELK